MSSLNDISNLLSSLYYLEKLKDEKKISDRIYNNLKDLLNSKSMEVLGYSIIETGGIEKVFKVEESEKTTVEKYIEDVKQLLSEEDVPPEDYNKYITFAFDVYREHEKGVEDFDYLIEMYEHSVSNPDLLYDIVELLED